MGVMDALGTTGRAAARKEEDSAERNMVVERKGRITSQSHATSILIGSITQTQPITAELYPLSGIYVASRRQSALDRQGYRSPPLLGTVGTGRAARCPPPAP